MSQYRLIASDAPANARASGLSAAVIAARFNEPVVAQLIEGAVQAWRHNGGAEDRLAVARVPGAFELPLAVKHFAASGRYDFVVALGCIIRGDTPHFEFIAGASAQGLSQAALATGVPVAFGVLTVENLQQALERAALDQGNKGGEALESALQMALLLRQP